MIHEIDVLNTVARTSLLDGPLKQLNKGGSRIAPFTVKRDANNHSRDNNDEVDGCVSQLKVIIKGDIVAAKQFGSEATESSEECEDSDIRKQRWTSFQFAEVTDLLKKTLGLKSWKCEYCGEEKKATDNGDNVIRGIKAKNSENIVESDDDSAIDEQSEVEDEGAKKKRGKSSKAAKEFKEHKKKTKINVLPSEVREILKDLWRNHPEFCSFIGDLWQSGSEKNDYAMFFLESILVPPTKFRPPTKEGDNVMEHPQTVGLNKVLESNIALGNARTNQLEKSKIVSRWMDLQESVNVLFDSKTSSVKSQREQGTGICQVLEKKEGLFRQKMMGKRVNHACRSVISPDPYIAVNDIGIPPCFALKLTYPERVTPWNVEKLRKAIINGPDIHPGATQYSDKVSTVKLPSSRKARIAIANKLFSSRGVTTQLGKTCDIEFECKIVYRHMQDGDVVLVNR
ncbi:hypothetical protein Bca101_098161 [Brassica carinata]